MDEETISQNNSIQADKQGEPANNETVQSIQKSNNPITNDNSKSEPTNTIKTAKRKKTWIIIVIIASILAIVGGGIAIAYNNGLFGDDEDCMCAAPPGVKQCRNCDPNVDYKPIIYLYPKEETNISVKLGYPELITADYPSYNYGWNVTAYPDGNLKIDDRNYYALYYESQNKIIFDKNDTGFVVESNRIASFLEDKLSILGLNEKESELIENVDVTSEDLYLTRAPQKEVLDKLDPIYLSYFVPWNSFNNYEFATRYATINVGDCYGRRNFKEYATRH